MPLKDTTLYGIGIGPGDPELITVKALNTIKKVKTIFAPSSPKNSYSLALDIISPYIQDDTEVHKLMFPMTKQKEQLEKSWERNAQTIIEYLKKGINCAFITLGDPLTYSTFGYTSRRIREICPEVKIEIIPGITSYHASAAASGIVLAEAEESLAIISGVMGAKKLRSIINHVDNVVVLKVYKSFKEIAETIDELGLEQKSVLVSRCGLKGERIVKGISKCKNRDMEYLSLIIINKNREGT